MTGTDIFWILLIFLALQPLIRQKALQFGRKRLIAKIEQSRKSRMILLVHRQESMALLGFPIFRFIDIHDSEEVIRAIHLTDNDVPIDMVLHTPGGLVWPPCKSPGPWPGIPARSRSLSPITPCPGAPSSPWPRMKSS